MTIISTFSFPWLVWKGKVVFSQFTSHSLNCFLTRKYLLVSHRHMVILVFELLFPPPLPTTKLHFPNLLDLVTCLYFLKCDLSANNIYMSFRSISWIHLHACISMLFYFLLAEYTKRGQNQRWKEPGLMSNCMEENRPKNLAQYCYINQKYIYLMLTNLQLRYSWH